VKKYLDVAFWAAIFRGNPTLRRYLLKRKISPKYPTFLLIEPTNHCNLKCIFCPRGKSSRELGFMSFQTLENIINDSLKYGKRPVIGFQKDGEPLLHRELEEMISYTRKKGAARIIHMATNGILLDENRAERIIKSGIDDLLISLDASSPETYKKVKGVDTFSRVEENVRNFFKIRKVLKVNKPFVRVKIINMRGAKDEITEFKRKWRGIADRVEVRNFVPWGEVEDNSPLDYSRINRYPCPYLWYMAAINWDGRVSICCGDYKCEGVLGNANETSLYDMWHGELLHSMRMSHLSGKFDEVAACKDCKVWLQEEDIHYWLKKKFLTDKLAADGMSNKLADRY
jgi:MoaA/NifB/PqqE/SkfB family radical SAM enzyme